jgi:hypothetical protein
MPHAKSSATIGGDLTTGMLPAIPNGMYGEVRHGGVFRLKQSGNGEVFGSALAQRNSEPKTL